MYWIDIKKKKPNIGEEVLIFEQGYSASGTYFSDYVVAVFTIDPWDKRKKVFVYPPDYRNTNWRNWGYFRYATHWMKLPNPPKQITKEQYKCLKNKLK